MWHAASSAASSHEQDEASSQAGDLLPLAVSEFRVASSTSIVQAASKVLTAKLSPMGSSWVMAVRWSDVGKRVCSPTLPVHLKVCAFEPLPATGGACAEEEMQNSIHEKAKELIKSKCMNREIIDRAKKPEVHFHLHKSFAALD